MKQKCPYCNKPVKEDTEGNEKFCQGHLIFEPKGEKKGGKKNG